MSDQLLVVSAKLEACLPCLPPRRGWARPHGGQGSVVWSSLRGSLWGEKLQLQCGDRGHAISSQTGQT